MPNAALPVFTLADLQSVAPRVLERLGAMAKLPTLGTVAGQSVASVLWEELGHPCRGPVNDIDVFVNMRMPRTLRGLEEIPEDAPYKSNHKVLPTALHTNDIGSATSDYEHIKFIAVRATTNILRTYQVGLVNYTLIDSPLIKDKRGGHSDEVSQGLIEGFDLNMVGVGINLETGRVVASEGFLEFLNTRQLRVETCNTPAHTLIRLAKKAFDGEISGIECDYPTERTLLELAVLCQQNDEPSLVLQSDLHSTVTRFGGGKYKAMYDRFADKLPSLLAHQDETHSIENPYIYYTLRPKLPLHQDLLRLASLSRGQNSLPPLAARTTFIAKLPQIFELFYPKRSFLDMDEIKRRRAHFDAILPQGSEANTIHCLQAALGKPLPKIVPNGMREEDAVLFFFNQDCNKSPQLVKKACETWDNLSDVEKHIVHVNEYRADCIIGIGLDRAQGWKSILRTDGAKLLSTIAASAPRPGLAQIEDERPKMLNEMFTWLEEMGDSGTKIVKGILPVFPNDDKTKTGEFPHILQASPVNDRAAQACKLLKWVIPEWPDLSNQPASVCEAAIVQLATAKQEIPTEVWTTLPQEYLSQCIISVCDVLYEYSSPSKEIIVDSYWENNMPDVLRLVPDEQFGLKDSELMRALIHVGQTSTLLEEINKRPGIVMDQAIQGLIQFLKEDDTVRNLFTESQWTGLHAPEKVIAEMETALLGRSTTPTPLQPRRALRL